jgi:hypothetical protein
MSCDILPYPALFTLLQAELPEFPYESNSNLAFPKRIQTL